MAERYQVRERRIWDSETDMYSMLFESEGDAKHVIGWLTVDGVRLQFRPLDQWPPESDPVEQPANDPVNNPSHYTQSGIQCDDAIRAMLGPEGYESYVRGTMTAYLWRLPHKGQAVLDAGKVRRYSDWLLEIVKQIHQ